MTLQGAPQLHARLAAVRKAPRGIAKDWADETAKLARARVARRTGATQRSIVVQQVGDTGATVVAGGAARFLEGGTKRHDIEPNRAKVLRFTEGGRPAFARKVRNPGSRRRPFMRPAALQAYKTVSPGKRVTDAWNKAA
jgi:hypothetical protein